MYRTDADGNVSNMFDPGDPAVPRQPTQVDSPWLNEIQEELVSPILSAGISLVKGTRNQLLSAMNQLYGQAVAHTWSALQTFTGDISLAGGTQPSASTALLNKITRANFCKAWGVISTNGSGGVSVVEGCNLGTPSIGSSVITMPFATGGGMASANYAVVGSQVISASTTSHQAVGFHSLATGSFGISVFGAGGSRADPATGIFEVLFAVFAKQ